MDKLLEIMRQYKTNLESDMKDLSDEMEKLDPNSKDFTELDFEYNWTNGQFVAAQYLLRMAEDLLPKSS